MSTVNLSTKVLIIGVLKGPGGCPRGGGGVPGEA